jgi:phospholipid-transporting ATPase
MKHNLRMNSITLDFIKSKETYTILALLEFTSDRKCMSILVQDEQGRKFIYSKGADQVIFQHLDEKKIDSNILQQTQSHLVEFSQCGLRILVVAYAEIEEIDYQHFKKHYEEARSLLMVADHEAKMLESYAMVETNLKLLGATAVEDRLQDKVPETIDYLFRCGIHIWMLTGDKQETAINIGHSSGIITSTMEILVLNVTSAAALQPMLENILTQLHHEKGGDRKSSSKQTFVLVVDGTSLNFALYEEYTSKFLEICKQCHSVICCRVGPLQKSMIVELVRKKLKCICLAIGDGANDVSMIEMANIGVGISGKEGTQASQASDYAFAQFKCLKRLLAVHGRYSYLRMSSLIMYSFYKNMAFILVQFWFGFFSAWSAQVSRHLIPQTLNLIKKTY